MSKSRPSMNPLDLALIAAAVLAFVFSFFKYYTADIKDNLDGEALCRAAVSGAQQSQCSSSAVQQQIVTQIQNMPQQSDSESAWHGFFGWFGAVLVLLAAAVIAVQVFAPQVKLAFAPRLAALVLSVVGLISTVVALFVIPKDSSGDVPKKVLDLLADFGHGFGYWVTLALSVVVVVLAGLRFTQTKNDAPVAGPGYGGTPPVQ